MSRARLAIVAAVFLALAVFFAAGAHRFFTFDNLKAQVDAGQSFAQTHPAQAAALFMLLYIAIAALSLPGAVPMTLAGGALFGLAWGTVLVSFASSIGATLAFLASRLVLRDWVQARFAAQLKTLNEGFARDGGFYLFTLRLLPAVPFFVINLAMGLTPIRAGTFYWVSQLGMLAGTLVYVNAGTRLAAVESPAGILSPGLIGAFVVLGLFPLLAKKTIDGLKARKVYARWPRPRRFERNLVVIGAGSAGLVSAYIAAAVRAKVTLVEKHRMGGDCLNTGCVPSKALLRSAKLIHQMRNASHYGLRSAQPEFDFAAIMARVQRVIGEIEPHDSVERYTGLGVECLQGDARITSPWSVEVGGRTITTRAIIVAAGARPLVPPIPGLDAIRVLTSDNLWDLRELPRRLVVLGGGPIGCELAQAFARFGSEVVQIEMQPRLLAREDPEVSEFVLQRFKAEGIDVRTSHRAKEVRPRSKTLVAEHEGREVEIEFDEILCALGRAPNTAGYGLETLGIPLGRGGTVATNDYLQTVYPNIYACGDVAGPYQFTHTAAHQAWYASVNALFAPLRRFRVDYSVIPWATFIDPEVARVGLSETEAREQGIAFETTRFDLAELDRAIADGAARGWVKVLTAPRGDRILGATLVGEHAGDLIAEFVAAMRHGIGLKRVLSTIHIYPTLAEANKYAAGAWRRAHAPQRALRWLERVHAWRRG